MALIILDPNLEGEAGHHLAYDLAIAREALARGEAATIIANRRFAATTIAGVNIVPHFTETCYAVRHPDPVTGRLDDYRHFNDVLQGELAALPVPALRPSDAVLVPTVTENHLAGYAAWMKGFDPADAPLFVVHLMFPSGFAVDDAGRGEVEDQLGALFYRLADRVAQEPGPAIHLFASGGQHAAEYGALFGRAVVPHPLPIRPDPAPRLAPPARRALLFAGDARSDKGVTLLPDLAPRLAEAHPDWTFVAHVNTASAWGEAKAAGEALAGLAGGIANLEVATGRLAPADYLALLQSARIALFPYDPALYRRKSSGVLWEAISLGAPVVVPAGTWLEYEARHWGAGHAAYAGHRAGAIVEAFAAALPRIGDLEARSAVAGARYRAANGPGALMDQIGALWVRHKATSSLVTRPRSMAIDLARLDAGWHRPEVVEGRPVRWSAKEPVVAFDWPFDEPWELELRVLSFFGAEQLDRIEAWSGDRPVALTCIRDGRGARIMLRGEGPGRARPRVEVRVCLPFTYRPPNETRDLGVLMGAVRVGPASRDGAAGGPAAAGPSARVVGLAPSRTGWPIAPAISGEVAAGPDAPCVLAFRLRAASVPAVRGLSLFVNAAPLRLTVSAEAGGTWLATTEVPANVLRREGTPGAWDLLRDTTIPGEAPVLLSVSAAAMAGMFAMPASPEADDVPTADASAPEDFAEAMPSEVAADGVRIRWDLSSGIGPEEGPFPDLGIPAGVRWVVARQARLVLEASAGLPGRLTLGYRSLLPRQGVRVAINGGPEALLEAGGAGLLERADLAFDLALRAGENEVLMGFAGAVKEPGSGRDLVLLIERLDVVQGGAAASAA